MQHQIFFPDYRRFQDPPFLVRAMITAKEFYIVPVELYCIIPVILNLLIICPAHNTCCIQYHSAARWNFVKGKYRSRRDILISSHWNCPPKKICGSCICWKSADWMKDISGILSAKSDAASASHGGIDMYCNENHTDSPDMTFSFLHSHPGHWWFFSRFTKAAGSRFKNPYSCPEQSGGRKSKKPCTAAGTGRVCPVSGCGWLSAGCFGIRPDVWCLYWWYSLCPLLIVHTSVL